LNVLTVRAGSGLRIMRTHPGIHEKVQSPDLRVPRRIVSVMQLRPAWNVALELHPVEPLNIFPRIGFDEHMYLTIGNVVEDPTVRADILNGSGKLDEHSRIVVGRNGVAANLAFRQIRLASKQRAEKNPGRNLFQQSSPPLQLPILAHRSDGLAAR